MRELSGPFGWLTPAVADLTEAHPEFWRYAVRMDRAALHSLGLILSHCETAAWHGGEWRSFAHALQFTPRRQAAAAYAPFVPQGAFNLTGKLKGELWRPATYRRLAGVCRDKNARKWLGHAARVCPRDLMAISRLPPAFRSRAFIEAARTKGELAELRYRIAIARRVYPQQPDHVLARMIEQKGVRQPFWQFRNAIMPRLEFPLPPWDGDARLRPIRTYAELERTALRFRNCVRTYVFAIREGRSALYVYSAEGEAAAVVEIALDAVFGWEFSEASGPDNDRLPAVVHYDILRRLQAAGISTGRELPMLEARAS